MLCENIDQKQRSLCRMRKSIVNIAFGSIVTTFRETTCVDFCVWTKTGTRSIDQVCFISLRAKGCFVSLARSKFIFYRSNKLFPCWTMIQERGNTYVRTYVGKYIQNTCTWEDGRENNYSVRKSADSCNPMANTLMSC